MPSRLVAVALALTACLAAGGAAWELFAFGPSAAATAARVEREVRETVSERAGEVESLARRVVREGELIAAASASRDRLPALFDRLLTLAEPVDQHGVAVTLYVPDGPANSYRVLAWSDGPGEKNLAPERLAGPATLFIAPGHAGMRMVFVDPVEYAGRRVAVAVAETVIATTSSGPNPERLLATSFGPVSLTEQYASTREEVLSSDTFAIASATGAPLLEIHVNAADLAGRRTAFRHRVLAVAMLPLVALAGLLAFPLIQRRRRALYLGEWLTWTVLAGGAVSLSAAGLILANRFARPPVDLRPLIIASWCWALAAVGPGGCWWRRLKRRRAAPEPVRFIVEQFAAGALLAAAVAGMTRLTAALITPAMLDEGQSVLFPFDPHRLVSVGTLLIAELAVSWAVGSILAGCAFRWRLTIRHLRAAIAACLWTAPTVALPWLDGAAIGPAAPMLTMAIAVVGFAILAPSIRRRYRRASQATRLLLAFAAVLAPMAVAYPLSATTSDALTRQIIEADYAPAIARHPQAMGATLERAQQEIDRLTTLADLLSGPPGDTQPAFLVWSQTSLSQSRVVSDVELYGPGGALVSRFALNLPEYVYRTDLQTWQGHNCTWEVFGERRPFGAEQRSMFHAERGVCDATGHVIGGLVVHVARDDYEALPFISSPNPYYDVLGLDAATTSPTRLPDLKVAVYGWGLQPLFTSGTVPWPISQDIFDRLYNPATPFWLTVPAEPSPYHVYFSQNRDGVYAFGYREATLVDHATRLAEITALAAGLFVALQVAALLYAPLTRQPRAPMRVLFQEIRTSFYRKLFLFFVAGAVVPVLIAAVAFGAYTTTRFRADVETEAAGTVTVARRVFEELTAATARASDSAAPRDVEDDVMVWIRQVINQDVNLYDGSELSATSQRDLYDSGLLPTRTPASVYHAIALQRRPTFLAEDRVGSLQYLVAAAPVVARGRDSVLTVPLAPRQRDIARETNTLYRRVLVGAVIVVLFAALLGASLASRVADPVARLTRATRQIAAGRLDVRVAVESSDELGRLVDDFNSMAGTLASQQVELARANQLKAWSEMARQVAHEIKNPLTPIQLAAEHLRHVDSDRGRPLGSIVEQCVGAILGQVRLLRQIASEFSTFAAEPPLRRDRVAPAALLSAIVQPYRLGLGDRIAIDVAVPPDLPAVWADATLLSRAITNLIENAIQAMPSGGRLAIRAVHAQDAVRIEVEDTGVGMDATALSRAFEPYFSTKTGGSGLGLANAKRTVERHGGTLSIESVLGQGTTITLVLPRAADLPG
ncbi:MAG: HAMP domain-containing sensor histidine kinase [Acidobacteriota bacterium]